MNKEGWVVGQYVVQDDSVAYRYKKSVYRVGSRLQQRLKKHGYKIGTSPEGQHFIMIRKEHFDMIALDGPVPIALP